MFFVIAIIAWLMTLGLITYFSWDGYRDHIAGLCWMVTLIFAFGSIIGFFVGSKISTHYSIPKLAAEYKIKSVNVGGSIKGNFVLGTGTISQERYYWILKIINKNTFTEEKIPVKDAILVESNKDPKVQKYKKFPNEFWFGYQKGSLDHYEVYIPKNTVTRQYKVQ